jgi:cytochrome c oxidase assembly protein subunit 15
MSTLPPAPSPLFTRLVFIAFGLMAMVLMLSAYLRLSGAGLGCAGWPACYGQGYADPAISKQASTPARLAHRLTATSLSLVILAISVMAWQRRAQAVGQWGAALLALGLTLFLSVLGIWTPGTRLPAVVLGNLLGGMALLGVLWWLSLSARSQGAARGDARFRSAAWFGLVLLFVQIGLGGLVSANFAASACTHFPLCETAWFETWSWAAFNPWRELVVQSTGAIAIPLDAAALHVTHWIAAVAITFYLLWIGLTTVSSDAASKYGKALVSLTLLQALLGFAAVKYAHPLPLVLAHNALAALLLLTLLSLAYRPRDHA